MANKINGVDIPKVLIEKFVDCFVEAGMTIEDIRTVLRSPENAAAQCAVEVISPLSGDRTRVSVARKIMGKRFLGIEDGRLFGFNNTSDPYFNTSIVPFSTTELKKARASGMILVAIPAGIFLENLFSKAKSQITISTKIPGKYSSKMAAISVRWGYFLMFPELFDSKGRTLADAINKVPKYCQDNFTGLSVVEVAYASLLWAGKYGKKLSRRNLRCYDYVDEENQLTVGFIPGKFTLEVGMCPKNSVDKNVALAIGIYRGICS